MLIDEIKKANIAAMKARDTNSRTAYSMIISRYQVMLTSGKAETPSDADVIHLIQKFAKELEEERNGYLTAGRQEDADAILEQKKAVEGFLPKMLSEEEIRSIIASLEDKAMPSVMKHFKMNYAGKVDMGLVSKIAKGL